MVEVQNVDSVTLQSPRQAEIVGEHEMAVLRNRSDGSICKPKSRLTVSESGGAGHVLFLQYFQLASKPAEVSRTLRLGNRVRQIANFRQNVWRGNQPLELRKKSREEIAILIGERGKALIGRNLFPFIAAEKKEKKEI
jgi:hypothetical protein